MNKSLISTLLASSALIFSVCASSAGQVHIYNWAEYIGNTTIKDFQEKTGIQPVYDTFDSNETLEAKLLAGNSGYDVVVPSNHFLGRQLKAGAFQKLDRSQLSNWNNLNKKLLERLQTNDPNNEYAVPYLWGTTGIAYNVEKVKTALGVDSIDSWSVLLEPESLKKLSSCGVALLDTPDEVFPAVLNYMGKNPNSTNASDYTLAEKKLAELRPYVTYFHNTKFVSDLANGNICMALSWSGAALQAKTQAEQAGNGVKIAYAIPKEGVAIWFDMLAIPAGAQNVKEAHAYINYLLEPTTISKISEYVGYANPNDAADQIMNPVIRQNPSVYPSDAAMKDMYVLGERPPAVVRLMTRSWNKIKTGQ